MYGTLGLLPALCLGEVIIPRDTQETRVVLEIEPFCPTCNWELIELSFQQVFFPFFLRMHNYTLLPLMGEKR